MLAKFRQNQFAIKKVEAKLISLASFSTPLTSRPMMPKYTQSNTLFKFYFSVNHADFLLITKTSILSTY